MTGLVNSSAMPQYGQLPCELSTTSGCIGQVYDPAGAGRRSVAVAPDVWQQLPDASVGPESLKASGCEVRYSTGLNEYFWPAIVAWYIKPPVAIVKIRMPAW